MAKKKTVGKKAQRVLDKASTVYNWDEKIKYLGRESRKARAIVANQTHFLDDINPEIVRAMEAKEEIEFLFDRTLVRLDYTFALGKDDSAMKKYDLIVSTLGQKFADRLYTRVDTPVPRHTETTFDLDQKALATLTKEEKRQLAKALKGKPKVYAGKFSERAKKRQSL
jgi:hypothetical protein